MNRQLSASVLATLLTLAGPASAQAVLKPPVNAKPGTGKTANVIMTEGGAAPCPKGPNGEDACTVTVTGERSGDGGGGGEALPPVTVNGSRTPDSPTPGLPSYDPGRDAGGGASGAGSNTKRLEAIKACQDEYKRNVKTVEDRFSHRTASCIAKNGGGIGPITYGVMDDFLGVFGASCYDRALADRDTELKNVNEANVACLTKAQNG